MSSIKKNIPLAVALATVAAIGYGMFHYLAEEDRDDATAAARTQTASASRRPRKMLPVAPQVRTDNYFQSLDTDAKVSPHPLALERDDRPTNHLQYDLRTGAVNQPDAVPYTRLADPTPAYRTRDSLGTMGDNSDMRLPTLQKSLAAPDPAAGKDPMQTTTSETAPSGSDPLTSSSGTSDSTAPGSLTTP